MKVTRHFVDVGSRRVHYRRCGSGPALLMTHQSPRSSAEYEPLMREWGKHFTCIAPDSPGFGQSQPLTGDTDIGDFADWVADLLDALGLDRVAAYGFHSGGIILMSAVRRHPERFTCLAIGGYAIWTEAEMALFAEGYLPPFQPSAYGEHLTWLWNRVLEQSWFFPWFAAAPQYRLSVAHADVARVDAVVRELLDAGDAYRVGYGAVLSAPRDIPPPDTAMPPVLITAYDGDPLQEHIDRLGAMPVGWTAHKVRDAAAHQADSLAFLLAHATAAAPDLAEAADEGFAEIATPGFTGALHWRGVPGGTLHVHGPGRALELVEAESGIAIDLPGHGLSDDWDGAAPTERAPWTAVIEAAAARFGCTSTTIEAPAAGDPARLFPDLTPDRFGNYLTVAWSIVRAQILFAPWYEASSATAREFDPAALDPQRLAVAHRALLNARAGRACQIAFGSD